MFHLSFLARVAGTAGMLWVSAIWAESFKVGIRVDAGSTQDELKPVWRLFGADEPNYAYPPKDYDRWAELVFQWVTHCVERYGRAEVESWYWQVWNEPNIGYWRGTPAEFHQLHDYALDAVRRALPTARVGGPDVAGSGGKFMRGFLEHCLRGTNYATGRIGTPIDFVSFHAIGSPVTTNGHVRMGIGPHLRTIQEVYPGFGAFLRHRLNTPGESYPAFCGGDFMFDHQNTDAMAVHWHELDVPLSVFTGSMK